MEHKVRVLCGIGDLLRVSKPLLTQPRCVLVQFLPNKIFEKNCVFKYSNHIMETSAFHTG